MPVLSEESGPLPSALAEFLLIETGVGLEPGVALQMKRSVRPGGGTLNARRPVHLRTSVHLDVPGRDRRRLK